MPVVGVIVHDITDPYFAEIVRGRRGRRVGRRLPRHHLQLGARRRPGAVVRPAAALDPRGGGRVRGQRPRRPGGRTRRSTGISPRCAPTARRSSTSRRMPRGEPEVGVDNAAGIATMVAALVELGHRRIAFLAGPASLFVARERLAGYRRGLADAGIAFDERLVVTHRLRPRRAARSASTRCSPATPPFTAIGCANDLLALGALQRLAELGIDVPGAVSVAGFDDISTAAITAPSLSTVRLPLRELGRRGFEHADRALAGDAPAPVPADGGRPARLDRGAAPRHGVDHGGRRPDGAARSPAASSSSPGAAGGSAPRSRSRPPPRAPRSRSTTTAAPTAAQRDAGPGPRARRRGRGVRRRPRATAPRPRGS